MKFDSNILVKCIVGIVLACAALILVQMWVPIFETAIFWKLIVTLVIIGSVVSFIIAVKQDLTDDKKMKDEKFLD